MKKSETFLRILQIPLDFILVVLAFYSAYRLRSYQGLADIVPLPTGYVPAWGDFLPFVLKAALLMLVVFALQNLYEIKFTRRFLRELPQIIYAIFIWAMLIMAWFFLSRQFFFSRLVLIYAFVLVNLYIVCGRATIRILKRIFLAQGWGRTRLLLIGSGELSERVIAALLPNRAYKIIGIIDDEEEHKIRVYEKKIKILGRIEHFKHIIKEHRIDEIIQAKTNLDKPKEIEILEYCHNKHITFRFLPDLFRVHATNIYTEIVAGLPVIELKRTALDGWGKVIKRAFDFGFALLFMLMFIPAYLIIGIIIKIDSPGPVLVKLKRISQGEIFHLYKFRSMVRDAHSLKKELAHKNERGDGPLFKIKDDPRITRIGKILRKTRVDEWPNILNVLKGEMSLVGPRPHEPEEVAKYKKHHKKLLAILPGVTGFGQVKGASDLSFEEEVRLDTYYIEKWSFWLDIEIILRTIWVVLIGRGAA